MRIDAIKFVFVVLGCLGCSTKATHPSTAANSVATKAAETSALSDDGSLRRGVLPNQYLRYGCSGPQAARFELRLPGDFSTSASETHFRNARGESVSVAWHVGPIPTNVALEQDGNRWWWTATTEVSGKVKSTYADAIVITKWKSAEVGSAPLQPHCEGAHVVCRAMIRLDSAITSDEQHHRALALCMSLRIKPAAEPSRDAATRGSPLESVADFDDLSRPAQTTRPRRGLAASVELSLR